MQADYWHSKWESDQLGFDQARPNALLLSQFHALGLIAGARIFVPLCGKTIDIKWVLDQGMRVCGAELSEIAVRDWIQPAAPQIGAAIAARANEDLYRTVGTILTDLHSIEAPAAE